MYLIPRAAEVTRWQHVLEQCLQAIENEIAELTEEKSATERELESLTIQLNTVAECIRQRDSRYGNDLVLLDEGDAELKNVSNSFISVSSEIFTVVECLDCGFLG
jgi:tektin-2